MNTFVRYLIVSILSVFPLCQSEALAAEPPASAVLISVDKPGKPKFKPVGSSTFLTFNVENIQFQRHDPFFHYQNLAYGLKIGTMRNAGWYLSVMSNFNFKGLFKTMSANNINPYYNMAHSYVDGLFGLTFRSFKPVSFHIGAGYHYRTANYRSLSGAWGHLPSESAHGPLAAAGFMFHMSGFVLSAEAVGNYNLKANNFKEGLGVGFKLGIGFCVEQKKSTKKTKKKVSDKMAASELHFAPTTAGPDEYNIVFRHSYSKPNPEVLAIIENDVLLSKFPKLENLNANRPKEEAHEVDLTAAEEVLENSGQPQISISTNQQEPSIYGNQTVNNVSEAAGYFEELKDGRPLRKAADAQQDSNLVANQMIFEIEKPQDMPTEPVFPCKDLTVKDVDGNIYHTLAIGDQCWLRENMRATRFTNGDSIMLGDSFDSRNAVRYCPGGSASNVEKLGYLYNWHAVARLASGSAGHLVQGVCPDGWHIPAMAEWDTLIGYLSAQPSMNCKSVSQYVAKALASRSGWAASEADCAIGNDLSTNNASGFQAMPAGLFSSNFDFFGKVARYWSSSVGPAQGKCDVILSWDDAIVRKSDQEPSVVGLSIRCLKN